MKAQVFLKVILLYSVIFSPAHAGFLDFIFDPNGTKKDQLSFRNPVEGNCVGMSSIEAKFSKDNRKELFNPRAKKDTPYEVERKMRAYMNGDKVQFNGYSSLNEMSSENKDVFLKLSREIQLRYKYNFHRNGGRDVANRKVEASYMEKAINRSRSGLPANVSIDDGTDAHAMTLHSVMSESKDRVVLKVRDPNTKGLKELIVFKDKYGKVTNRGYYSEWRENVTFVGASDERHKARLGRTPKYTNIAAHASREGVWRTH